jgi:hypothetical protein
LGTMTMMRQLVSDIEKGVPSFRMPDHDRSIFEIKPEKIFTYK